MEYNIVTAELDPRFPSRTVPLYQYDYGQILKFEGVELPDAYEVHFSNEDAEGTAKVQIGTSDGVEIPDEYLLSGEPIYVWVFLHTGESDGETEYKTVIPVHKRAQVEDVEPTPVQQDVITQTIAALNTAVERAETAQDAWESMSATAETLAPNEPATASYEDGVLTFGIPEGKQGEQGDEGNGIASTVLNADYTLTINFTDGTSYTTESIRGAQGNDGVGIASTVLNADYTLIITLTDGTSYTTPSIRGEKGDTGRAPQITASKTGNTTTIYADGLAIGTVEDGIGVPTGGTAGQVLTKKSTADGDTEWQDASGGTVTDVTVNGTSVLDSQTGVAEIPLATNNSAGALQIDNGDHRGLDISNGKLSIYPASGSDIKGSWGDKRVLTPPHQHESTFYGLAKAAGDSTQAASSNPVGTYTDEAKSAIKTMLGVTESPVQDVQINNTTILDANGVAKIPIAGSNILGAVNVRNPDADGIFIGSTGYLQTYTATSLNIKSANNSHRPIASSHQHESTFYGLAKAAGDTTQSQSSNPVGTYTDEAKAKICEMLGIPYERLLYRNDTFGNVWTEYQPTGVDFENNAIILSDDTGLPTEISPVRCAHLIAKPLLTLQYGTIPTELYEANRIKAIGDNKIQFYDNSGGLVTFTDTSYIDMTKFKLLYRPSPNSDASTPIFSDFDASHKIHVRMTVPAMLEGSCGIKALDVDGNTIRGASYGAGTTQKSNSVIYTKGDAGVAGMIDYDGYGILIGNRNFSTLPAVKNTYAQYDVWFWPSPAFGGCEYEAKIIYFAANNSNKKNQICPCISFSRGFTSVPIAQVTYSANNPKDFPAPNSILEVWDCGTVY